MMTTRPLKTLLCMSFYAALSGCATVGHSFDTTHVSEVRRGLPRAEIVAWFGEPIPGNKQSLADSPQGCVKRYEYNFATASESHVLWIDFDARDAVCNVVYSGVVT